MAAVDYPPKTNQPRPSLPIVDYNVRLQEEAANQPVKFQIIVRDGHEIIVGRVKVPTPNGHAFILRRFDTGAVSLSTMFRAAYPNASDEAEKAELNWVRNNYDIAGQNGGGKLRLAGIWVPPGLALHFAELYGLGHILPGLAHAKPEEKSSYRKGGRPNNGSSTVVAAAPAVGTTTSSQPEPASGLGIPTSLPPTSPFKSPKSTPAKPAKASSPARQPPPKRSRKSASPAPSLLAKPTPTKPVRSSPRRPPKVQEEEEEAEVPGPNPDQDIREAQEDVARIMAQGRAAQQLDPVTPAGKKKRNIESTETPPHQLDLVKVEQGAMVVAPVERAVVNPRRLANLPPTQKAAAWGGLLMAVGWGAATYLPQYLPNAFGFL
ncbi:hypothetical protein FRB90_001365 [Tulasnella sp. 427]|nr:hypothetical protein FRB90_001365 [Tulasnella sp. 427]